MPSQQRDSPKEAHLDQNVGSLPWLIPKAIDPLPLLRLRCNRLQALTLRLQLQGKMFGIG